MQLFECPSCSATVFFDSVSCESCSTELNYRPDAQDLTRRGKRCANRDKINCNWLVESEEQDLCRACRTTTLIPDLSVEENMALWEKSELAKRWILANLGSWGWFTAQDTGPSPVFHLISEQTGNDTQRVVMGHQDGVVTINVAESNPVVRVTRREQFNEPYRTMIGHFRHELAHYVFFERLYGLPGFIDEFRAVIGDERDDYAAAMSRYYQLGPQQQWEQSFVSGYASSHPHEDWAETFAHLLHLTDIADTFIAVGFSSIDVADKNFRPYRTNDAGRLLSFATDLTIGLNQLNRSMGLSDIYPFVLTPTIRDKISFVHRWVTRGPAN